MRFESVIRRRFRRILEDNVDVEARVNAAIAGNVGDKDGVATAVAVDSDEQTTRNANTTSERRRG